MPLALDIAESPPQGIEEQVIVQFTPLLLLSFSTVAVNLALPPHCTFVDDGEIETLITGGGGGADAPPPHETMPAARSKKARNPRCGGRCCDIDRPAHLPSLKCENGPRKHLRKNPIRIATSAKGSTCHVPTENAGYLISPAFNCQSWAV